MANMLPHHAAGQHGASSSHTHPGMFAPGTKVQVGKHRVIVEKYLSEGGFAHVYLVRDPQGDAKFNPAVLKRVAVPDKDHLANMRTEVETMKKLKGHRHIVTYIDSHASQLSGGGYEVFLLMEFCNGGGLIDFMNTRLQVRLTEPEILKIISDVALGVACMHYLKPPLLHRDLKVENVLITSSGSSRMYKLCDFGSTAQPRPAAKNAAEGRLIEDDIQRHTTLQYRSPEMIDVYRRQPIDEKSDIWALGVLLYKLCYYTTPFEDQGQMAILNATFKFPSYPPFSDRLKKLISSMLRENPQQRPNIYLVAKEVCAMRGADCPIQDIYANRSASETRRYEQMPSTEPINSPPIVGITKVKSADPGPQSTVPDIAPMRRGRPTTQAQSLNVSAKATPAGSRTTSTDPFAALDSKDVAIRAAAADELANKFPSLDEFSLLHDQGAKFEFTTPAPGLEKKESLNKRVTEVLADEAFGNLDTLPKPRPADNIPVSKTSGDIRRVVSIRKPKPEPAQIPKETRSHSDFIHEPMPHRPVMVSTGIQTSPSPSPSPSKRFEVSTKPIWRIPASETERSASLPQRQLVSSFDAELPPRPEKSSSSRPSLLERHRTKSQTLAIPRSPASSRPSLEGQRPSALDLSDPISRSRSANARPRPASAFVESNLDYLKDRESSRGKALPTIPRPEPIRSGSAIADESSDEDGPDNIDSNLSYLRAMENEGSAKKKSRRSSSGKSHRKNIPSISLSGTKNIITGKFSDAFRRFEGGQNREQLESPPPDDDLLHNRVLTPIAGSEATGTSGRSDDENPMSPQEMSPELRREMERQQLEEEEQRVAAHAMAHKNRQLVGNGTGNAAAQRKGTAIQNRVHSLLNNAKEVQVSRTAEGYGRFTEVSRSPVLGATERIVPLVARKPVGIASGPPATNRTGSRPDVAPKPRTLRTGGPNGGRDEAEDWEASFQKKYPALQGLEMVETDIKPATRIKDV